MLPKLVLTDIDGVWTDGGMYYDERGNELKKFHTYDSAGTLYCKLLKIPVGIITGETTAAVERRAVKLGIDILRQGVKNKLETVQDILATSNLEWEELAYIGDDINDIDVLRKARLSACPSSSPFYIKQSVTWILDKKGGEGVFREFVEKILYENNIDVLQLLKSSKDIVQ